MHKDYIEQFDQLLELPKENHCAYVKRYKKEQHACILKKRKREYLKDIYNTYKYFKSDKLYKVSKRTKRV